MDYLRVIAGPRQSLASDYGTNPSARWAIATWCPTAKATAATTMTTTSASTANASIPIPLRPAGEPLIERQNTGATLPRVGSLCSEPAEP